jgi:hypothetical protein
MKLWTYREVLQKITTDLDLQDQQFITPDEMVGYCNEAIHEAESEILKLNEDYFLSMAPLSLVQAQNEYALPAGIYSQKIRSIQYLNGALNYPIRRVRGGYKFDDAVMLQQYAPNDDYQYILLNSVPGAQSKILLLPTSRESGPFVTIWFIRSAQSIPTAADVGILPTAPNSTAQLDTVLDIPEFTTFVIDFMKAKCLAKDGDPRYTEQVAALENQRKMMVDSLTQQVPDDQDYILPDMSFYNQSS